MDILGRDYEARFTERQERNEDTEYGIRKQRSIDMDDRFQKEAERDLPPHKRSGYAERLYEMADDYRKRIREEAA